MTLEMSWVSRLFLIIREHPMWILTIIFITMPFFSGGSWSLVTHVLIFSLLAISYNLLLGQTGLLSFGHSLFFGIGAYSTGLLLVRVDPLRYPVTITIAPAWFAWIALFVGPLIAAAVAIPTGLLNLRRAGTYFALLTLSWSMVAFWFFDSDPLSISGGQDGLSKIPTPPIFGLKWRTPVSWYYFIMIIVLLSIYVIRRISTSPFGGTLKAVRDDELRTRFLGYNTQRIKLMSFITSAFFSGLAGSLLAFDLNFVGSTVSHWWLSGEVLIITLLGGTNTFFGPIIGAYVFIFLKDLITLYTRHWQMIMGVIVMAFLAGFYGLGIMESLEKIIKRLKI